MANHFESDLVLNQRLLQIVAGGIADTLEMGNDLSQYCQDDENLKRAAQDTMLSFINMDNEINQQIMAIKHMNSVRLKAQSEDNEVSLTDVFRHKLEELRGPSGGCEETLKKHSKFQELQMILDNTGDIEEQLASLRQALVGNSEDDSQQGDLAFTEAEVNTRCPYTGTTMRDPVKNIHCGHVYDREGILTYIRQKKAKAKCPVGGCGNTHPIQAADLEQHVDMKRYITLMSQSQRL